MLPLDPRNRELLRQRGVSDKTIDVALQMVEDINLAGEDVVRDTGEESFDDPTSKGQLHYRRSRNRIDARFAGSGEVECDDTDRAFQVCVDGVNVSFYSARFGVDNPNVVGSKSKKHVVDECQMMLELDDAPNVVRLVLLHERGDDGVTRCSLGVLRNSTTWEWKVTIYDRFMLGTDQLEADRGPAYDQLDEPELPGMGRRENEDEFGAPSSDIDRA